MAAAATHSAAIMATSEKESDLFDLEGKNPRRVLPQIRISVRVQRDRMRAALIALVASLAIAGLTIRSGGVWGVLGIGCLVMSPFSVLAYFADRHLLRYQLARLGACQKLIDEGPAAGEAK